MITWTDVINVAPELSATPSAARTSILADAYGQMSPGVWGGRLDAGAAYLSAHLATLALRQAGAAGALTEQHAGPVGESFAAPTGVPGQWAQTSYGVEYWRRMRSLAGARFAISAG